jgi:hypothetical protein
MVFPQTFTGIIAVALWILSIVSTAFSAAELNRIAHTSGWFGELAALTAVFFLMIIPAALTILTAMLARRIKKLHDQSILVSVALYFGIVLGSVAVLLDLAIGFGLIEF